MLDASWLSQEHGSLPLLLQLDKDHGHVADPGLLFLGGFDGNLLGGLGLVLLLWEQVGNVVFRELVGGLVLLDSGNCQGWR